MFLGIDILWWMLGLGLLAIWLSMPVKRKSMAINTDDGIGVKEGDIEGYIKSLQEITEMGWVTLRVNPEDLSTVLNKIEETKISVMYQFYLREHKYDMLFRCQKNMVEEFEIAMSDYIPSKF